MPIAGPRLTRGWRRSPGGSPSSTATPASGSPMGRSFPGDLPRSDVPAEASRRGPSAEGDAVGEGSRRRRSRRGGSSCGRPGEGGSGGPEAPATCPRRPVRLRPRGETRPIRGLPAEVAGGAGSDPARNGTHMTNDFGQANCGAGRAGSGSVAGLAGVVDRPTAELDRPVPGLDPALDRTVTVLVSLLDRPTPLR